jgi:ATP-dependent Lon protease
MEIITISGYTLEEKTQIAKQYLVPEQIKENGLTKDSFSITEKAIQTIIDGYTRESGVRNLNREIGSVVRGVASQVASDEIDKAKIDADDVSIYLGKQKFYSDVAERTKVPGVATGMAWTPYGGDILFIEASVAPGSGKITITGQLGDVMKESATLAMSYLKAHADRLSIPQTAFTEWDLHIHVPAGAVPKDGPSAGVSIMSAIASIFTQRCVRNTLALTGEITLRGLVLPVGGIKEKVLAARRAGIKEVLIPRKNENDYSEIEANIVKGLKVSYLERMEEVLDIVLDKKAVQDPAKKFAPKPKVT